MPFGFFKKNVVENLWEAIYSTGKSTEIYYIRTESEYMAKGMATEHGNEIGGMLLSLKLISDGTENNDNKDRKDSNESDIDEELE